MPYPTLLFLIGESGSGKTVFRKTRLEPEGLFYNLRSATTRQMRLEEGETEGHPYFFRDEAYFETEPLITHLWVNKRYWTPEKPKWMYGVPESEVLNNIGRNLVYDVIQPCYAAEMIKWFEEHNLRSEYNIKVAWFIPSKRRKKVKTIRTKRANMPDDKKVREKNKCTAHDILKAGLEIDYMLCPLDDIFSARLNNYIAQLYDDMVWQQSKKLEYPVRPSSR